MTDVTAGAAVRLDQFVAANAQTDSGGTWQIEKSRTLEINLSGSVFIQTGAMIGYYGEMKFTRAGAGGASKWMKKAFTGEGATMTEVTGSGVLYCADRGKQVTILQLAQGETIFVNGHDCLAYSDSIDWDIVMTGGAGMMAGGLFSLQLTGPGFVAITTHGAPLVLGVTPEAPLSTDPNATVGWSSGVKMSMKTDVNFKTMTGRASGETFQMKFSGSGFVVLQPFEEIVASAG